MSRTVIGLQTEALVLASVLLVASRSAGAGGSAGLCAYHYLGARLSRGAWLCVFSLGRPYIAPLKLSSCSLGLTLWHPYNFWSAAIARMSSSDVVAWTCLG